MGFCGHDFFSISSIDGREFVAISASLEKTAVVARVEADTSLRRDSVAVAAERD